MLQDYILIKFQDTAFNQSIPFPTMNTPAAHTSLNANAEPYARHTPIPVPYHWKKAIKQSLEKMLN